MRLRVLLLSLVSLVDAQLLEVFGLANGNTGTVQRQPFQDIASQSVGLLNYLASVQKNPDNKLAKRQVLALKQPIPQVAFVDGLPVIPGVVGSLPGAGACLPRNAPLVRERSPSFFQNIVRNIPGAQDYLSSFLPQPVVNVNSLYGKYLWAIDTPSVHEKFCPTTEFLPATTTKSKASFSLVDKFRTQDENGGDKTAFGYGLVNNNVTYVYFQDDPCPYQVVMIGPIDTKSGQYEYVILSNWARFPIIGLVRDIRVFYDKYKDNMEAELEKEGFMNGYSTQNTIHYTDWSKCRRSTPVTYFRNVLSELFG